ncbi:uncharacterized protein [Triticum aestivum]|uniref:uncharacterized protein n=1 Tax=Triticum aestivum TaxID=4565 RepID=UPI001D023211|nr:uncharacterized protein LOC123170369 [Triticum aestivum]
MGLTIAVLRGLCIVSPFSTAQTVIYCKRIVRLKQGRLQPKSNLNLKILEYIVLIPHLLSILMQRLKLILNMKQHGCHHPNIHVQRHIIFKGNHLIHGKGFLFQSTYGVDDQDVVRRRCIAKSAIQPSAHNFEVEKIYGYRC